MVIWGGKNSSGTAINDGALYDIATNSWTTMTSTGAPSVRTYLHQDNVAMGTDNKVLIWGGYASGPGYLNSGAIYDIATNSWTTMLTNNLPVGRSTASVAWDETNSRLIYWGGNLTSSTYSSAMAFYYPQ